MVLALVVTLELVWLAAADVAELAVVLLGCHCLRFEILRSGLALSASSVLAHVCFELGDVSEAVLPVVGTGSLFDLSGCRFKLLRCEPKAFDCFHELGCDRRVRGT